LDAYVCDGTEDTVCDGSTTVNACNGCLPLANEPGADCGPCDLDDYVCSGTEATTCDGTTFGNACGGCLTLANPPGGNCGPCNLDEYQCDGTEDTVCSGTTYGNACNGCTTLANPPGTDCGVCDLDDYVCTGPETTACDGNTLGNACGGCTPLGGTVGEVCSCDGDGEALWCCDGTEALDCGDGNDLVGGATSLGAFDADDATSGTGYTDNTDDFDWYVASVADDADTLNVTAVLTPTSVIGPSDPEPIEYAVCAFFRYDDARQGNIVTYSCGTGDECYYYDSSGHVLIAGGCATAVNGFDAAVDLYGCCETDPVGDRSLTVQVNDLDGGVPDTGDAYILVTFIDGGVNSGCGPYDLDVTF
jgi:hypothetical protein